MILVIPNEFDTYNIKPHLLEKVTYAKKNNIAFEWLAIWWWLIEKSHSAPTSINMYKLWVKIDACF